MHRVTAGAREPFSDIKKRLEAVAGESASLIRLVYCGAQVKDSSTPADLDLGADACLHMTLQFPTKEQAFRQVISATEAPLVANCPFCHTAGAQFDPRPLCATCSAAGANNEAILVTRGAVERGKTTWGDLLNLQVQCFGCGNTGAAAVGFLCLARAGGEPCVSRKQRRLQYLYDGSGDPHKLFSTINVLLG